MGEPIDVLAVACEARAAATSRLQMLWMANSPRDAEGRARLDTAYAEAQIAYQIAERDAAAVQAVALELAGVADAYR